ncbi:MAG: transporter, permease protein [Myxococcaceae bacterium]|nr:transporter, permease protein [Myxococcaceae bacterium]
MRRLALAAPLLLFALLPLGRLVAEGLGHLDAIATAEARRALSGTLLTSSGAALFAFLLGLPLAVLLVRTDLPARRALRAIFTLPTALPPFIFGMGWVALANPKAGLLNLALGEGTLDIYGSAGIAFVLGGCGLPLVVLAASASLERVDASLEEAARLCGAGPLRTLAHVSLPLALPAALSGAALVFLFSASAFGVPYLLGVTASPPTTTLTTHVYGLVLMGHGGLASAGAIALVLLTLASAVLLASRLASRAGRVRLSSGKGIKLRPLALGPWRAPLGVAAIAIAGVLVALPLGAVFLTSLEPSFGRLENLSLQHWDRLLHTPRVAEAALRSVGLSLAAAALVTLLGLAYAVGRTRLGNVGRALELAAAWPYAVPGTVLGMGLLLTFSMDWRVVIGGKLTFVLALANTLWLVLIAYTARHLAFGVRHASDGLSQADPSLTEAARVCGAPPLRAFLDATLPQLKAPLAAAFTLTFLTCATELTLSVLLVPTGQDLLGTVLFELMSYADPAAASVLAGGFVLIVLTVLAGRTLLVRRPA